MVSAARLSNVRQSGHAAAVRSVFSEGAAPCGLIYRLPTAKDAFGQGRQELFSIHSYGKRVDLSVRRTVVEKFVGMAIRLSHPDGFDCRRFDL